MAESESLIGKLVAERYRISRRLGGGGMGTVYVALQEPLGRDVAFKVVRRELARDPRTLERFRREALSLAQAHHPNIVALHDFGELSDGSLFLAMELVKGDNLRQRLIKRSTLPFKNGIAIVRQVCAALSCAHGLGIIHRDLKPENILLMDAPGAPDFVKIVDFGVAKLTGIDEVANQQGEQLTASGSVVGTPGYIAPEVSVRGVLSDPRSDLYALGVMWFECLAGRPPFRAPTPTSLMMAHAVDPIPPLPSEVPLPIAGLVQRLLAKDPNDRPGSAEELAQLLDHLPGFESGASVPRPRPPEAHPDEATIDDNPRLSPRDLRAPLPSHAPTVPARPVVALPLAPRAARRAPALAAAALLLVSACGVLAWWWLGRHDTAEAQPDAGLISGAVPALHDAGPTTAVAAGATPAVDAGAAASDAGNAARVDAGPKKRARGKAQPRVPDIYD
ncbi:MAG: serine/threonine protein kinase [Deltaproteobacteria bacterium]|nr:serine/threonine protein kinase [Deltaproteobacteria bacterium]